MRLPHLSSKVVYSSVSRQSVTSEFAQTACWFLTLAIDVTRSKVQRDRSFLIVIAQRMSQNRVCVGLGAVGILLFVISRYQVEL